MKEKFDQTNSMHFHGHCFNSYQGNDAAFESLCDALSNQTILKNFIALQASPGLGKSAFFDKFADDLFEWRTNGKAPSWALKASNWLRDSIVISVTFNHLSPLQPEYNLNNN